MNETVIETLTSELKRHRMLWPGPLHWIIPPSAIQWNVSVKRSTPNHLPIIATHIQTIFCDYVTYRLVYVGACSRVCMWVGVCCVRDGGGCNFVWLRFWACLCVRMWVCGCVSAVSVSSSFVHLPTWMSLCDQFEWVTVGWIHKKRTLKRGQTSVHFGHSPHKGKVLGHGAREVWPANRKMATTELTHDLDFITPVSAIRAANLPPPLLGLPTPQWQSGPTLRAFDLKKLRPCPHVWETYFQAVSAQKSCPQGDFKTTLLHKIAHAHARM